MVNKVRSKPRRGSHGPRYRTRKGGKSYYIDVDRSGHIVNVVDIHRSIGMDAKKRARHKTRKTGYGGIKDKKRKK